MKTAKSILWTFVCAAAILLIGYVGIILGGKKILEVSAQPEQIEMEGDISNLFYSSIEDDITLYPWNFYPGGSDQKEAVCELFPEYSLFIENDVFYVLIALAADVDPQEVSRWYSEQDKTIMMNMVQGQGEDGAVGFYFYDDAIRLNGKDYQVKIACNEWSIISFSCIRQRGAEVKETQEWREQKELLTGWLEENPTEVNSIYNSVQLMLYKYDYGTWDNWYLYTYLYQECLRHFGPKADLPTGTQSDDTLEISSEMMADNRDYRVQMIELQDSLLLVTETDITVGIYYDVLDQRVTGFHVFWK